MKNLERNRETNRNGERERQRLRKKEINIVNGVDQRKESGQNQKTHEKIEKEDGDFEEPWKL